MKGTLSEEERVLFESWYDQNPATSMQWPGDETEEEVRSRIYDKINAELRADVGVAEPRAGEGGASERDPGQAIARPVRILHWWKVAAAVVVIAGGAFVWGAARHRRERPAVAVVHAPAHKEAKKRVDFIRDFTLPDGTHVVLQTGGRLDYPSHFAGRVREVSLSGEAYFEVAEDVSRPFIIHTGRVRTTVLGTAFNIRALPEDKEIVVSVTAGRVKVEDNRKLLAVLTSNQQVKYQPVSAAVSRDSVNAASLVTDWTKQEMAFDGQSFEEVAEILGRRYGVDIRFKKEGLKKCSIKAFFNGTETLENVLNTLCTISNTSYSRTDENTVVLDGENVGG
jgi:ferric-dicitrate binding protein FerR (iron transport regulator)